MILFSSIYIYINNIHIINYLFDLLRIPLIPQDNYILASFIAYVTKESSHFFSIDIFRIHSRVTSQTGCRSTYSITELTHILCQLLPKDFFKVRGSLNKFPDFFRRGTFIDSTHMKLYFPFEVISSGCNALVVPFQQLLRECPRGVMVKAMNCGIVVREFVLQSRYYVHFRANTLGKGMNPLILPPAMDK